MRGFDDEQGTMFSYISLEERVPPDHPLRPVRRLVDRALRVLSPEFEAMYARVGRPSIAPERLLRALLLQVFYTIRSERLLMEQLEYNLLFRWFVGLEIDEAVWDASTFSKNRERFLDSDIAGQFFAAVLEAARAEALLSDEHFSVDGTLVEAWASLKSFRPRDERADSPPRAGARNASVSFHGERRTNETHASRTDPEARLYRKGGGKEARLSFMAHLLMENRNGLVVDTRLTTASGTAERDAAAAMVAQVPGRHRITLGGDKAYDTEGFTSTIRAYGAVPHVAQHTARRRSAIDGRTTRHAGYRISQRVRKRVEEIFGWIKTVGNLRKTRHRGLARVGWIFTLTAAAYNLVRIRNLLAAAAAP